MSSNKITRLIILWATALTISGWPILTTAQSQVPLTAKLSPLVIISSDAMRNTFQIEFADNDAARAQGLMFRREMPADHGMLFDYGRLTDGVAMWMKNTFIPLDMLFIAADGRIVNIAERTIPQSLSTIYAAEPVRAVLELNGGTVSRLKIKPGDHVLHSSLGNLN